ncbi:MAG TPA: glycoside hydrolase family 3 N-terminal domain-containing protein, partial [Saprospiraceae bacterium]|nr:glycoside hydrolase family 3 N-terminal domain-containing protein [Saprospiraceae bacterium]
MACIKHFPGHGDTDVDSHEDLPILNHSRERLESTEFFPFRRLTAYGASALMVGHLNIPALDDRVNRPTTLSKNVIKNILRQEMGYNGLIFTDAMDMKGITKYYPNGVAEAEAFLAGNDVILLPEDLIKAIASIKQYISEGKISDKRLDESVLRILRAKYKLGLNTTPIHSSDELSKYLMRNQAVAVKEKLTEAAITLVSDNDEIIPIKNTNDLRLATLSFNKSIITPFQSRVSDYAQSKHYQLMSHQLKDQYVQLLQTLSQFDRVVVAIHTSGKQSAYNKEVSQEMIGFLRELNKKSNIIVVLFGSPYLLKRMGDLDNILLCHDNNRMTQDIAAQSLFGVNIISGKLPISVNDKWRLDHGLYRNSLGRLGYSVPERVKMNSDTLMLIDSIMAEMVRLNAAPGGQVVIAKDGKIVFSKSYGKLTSDGYYVLQNTIYDVASLTKY